MHIKDLVTELQDNNRLLLQIVLSDATVRRMELPIDASCPNVQDVWYESPLTAEEKTARVVIQSWEGAFTEFFYRENVLYNRNDYLDRDIMASLKRIARKDVL